MELKELPNNTKLNLFWHNYKFFPYERELAIREVKQLLIPAEIKEFKTSLEISTYTNSANIDKLVYFSHAQINDTLIETIQHKFERSINDRKRQNTRYSVHGLHEYKGKFNPQVVRSLFNIYGIKEGDSILDPFCGSGTTLVEASHCGINANGTDINPLAALIANTKINALSIKYSDLEKVISTLLSDYKNELKDFKIAEVTDRLNYLRDWFPEDILRQIEYLHFRTEPLSLNVKNVIRIVVSNLLRDYSLQEPKDLRIRRRKSPFPTISFYESLSKELCLFVSNLKGFQSRFGLIKSSNIALNEDIRNSNNGLGQFDFAITSPPYATALPYIDTQRLSLVWLSLIEPNQIRDLESQLIGSREFQMKSEQNAWSDLFRVNNFELPTEVFELCDQLYSKLSKEDGFRKRALPSLLYRYFYDMKRAFKNVHNHLKPNAHFALIVGHNHTMIGGTRTEINTPELLGIIGTQIGFKLHEMTALEAYQRYGLNASNAVQKESLIVFKK